MFSNCLTGHGSELLRRQRGIKLRGIHPHTLDAIANNGLLKYFHVFGELMHASVPL
jgi:hypothetical protein